MASVCITLSKRRTILILNEQMLSLRKLIKQSINKQIVKLSFSFEFVKSLKLTFETETQIRNSFHPSQSYLLSTRKQGKWLERILSIFFPFWKWFLIQLTNWVNKCPASLVIYPHLWDDNYDWLDFSFRAQLLPFLPCWLRRKLSKLSNCNYFTKIDQTSFNLSI